jgi:CBS domain-containing protein
MKVSVENLMTTPSVTVPSSAAFKDIVSALARGHFSALPVVDHSGRVVGVVSEGDLILKEERESLEERPRLLQTGDTRTARAKAEGLTAGELMSQPPITIGPQASIAEAAKTMHKNRVKRLPVVDRDGRPLGVISRADVLKVFLRDDQEIKRDVVKEIIVDALWMDPASVDVRVDQGIVHLAGEVERKSDIRLLEKMIPRVAGVVGVESVLTYREDDAKYRPEPSEPWAPEM